jgi:hypothetical protein
LRHCSPTVITNPPETVLHFQKICLETRFW